MKDKVLYLTESMYKKLRFHLLSEEIEDAAFMYVDFHESENSYSFEFLDWDPVNENDYESRSEYHLNISEETWAYAIKRAHDLDASLIEIHSHSGLRPVSFSGSDFHGFKEFVPHVLWRLSGKPYLALVVNETSCDGLVWIEDSSVPEQLDMIITGSKTIKPTKLSLKSYNSYE